MCQEICCGKANCKLSYLCLVFFGECIKALGKRHGFRGLKTPIVTAFPSIIIVLLPNSTNKHIFSLPLTAVWYTTVLGFYNFKGKLAYFCGPGERSGYSDSLRAGRSGDRIPVAERTSATVQTDHGNYPVSCVMGTGSFPSVKRPENGIAHLPPSSAENKERVQS
jgi:hypothetical protein